MRHDTLLHVHEHANRPPGVQPHSHLHGGPGQGGLHEHPHRHLYDLPALETLYSRIAGKYDP